ncbi:flap endonuclease GEN-like 1 isoform X2 [Ziziphus jujuba]|uniref:Flap endonuclease GEN-like 1 n=1 Tax=Ziziphus jujuba TaxID=326968 RepID=A0A6P6GQP7_ZIZJJ|nr:flap endonuclease GEN-like 1 isoform X2 [Ziziphus jujuba]
MGFGGKFWDLLKPYARNEGFDFLRNKRVAVDLSFWIVQHETAIKGNARNPHLRLIFFRTISLFAKFGAFPVFVVDGTPSPLKSKARIARFYRFSGIDLSSLPAADYGVSVDRNHKFSKCVQECVELLELFGMPVLKAKGEAEALCAQLESEGHVDACITSDSDAFLYGAKCVIKCFRPNSKEPFECYHMSEIEAGLGLKRKHLIAISLLVGNDHDLNGVQGIGLDTAVRFVQNFGEDEILNRLHEISSGDTSLFKFGMKSADDLLSSSDEILLRTKCSHCSFCGHPGNKRDHFKSSCEYCSTKIGDACLKKPEGFKCDCLACDMNRKEKEKKMRECWQTKICAKIAMEPNFPKNELIEMYLCNNHGAFTENVETCISWGSPKTELLVDFLAFHQMWEPSYIRQSILPMLSTIYLREMAAEPVKSLLHDQYEFDSIDRIRMRYGHQFYIIKWKKAVPARSGVTYATPSEESNSQDDVIDVDESINQLDELDVPKIHVDGGCHFLLTDENMELVQAAFPQEVDRFLQEKEQKESKRRNSESLRSGGRNKKLESPGSRAAQLTMTEFYRSTKAQLQTKPEEGLAENADNGGSNPTSKGKRKVSTPSLPKSVRRRLLFD